MLFNSLEFCMFFMPVVYGGFCFLERTGFQSYAGFWLLTASAFFYGYFHWPLLFLLMASVSANYLIGRSIVEAKSKDGSSRVWVFVGCIFNLSLLGVFKYLNFGIDIVNAITGKQFGAVVIMLPLAISFFTFQQVAYLVDLSRKEIPTPKFLDYALFVTFFPQLIAGPICRYHELFPQIRKLGISKQRVHHLISGMSIFFVGLAKKVLIADELALRADSVFAAVAEGVAVDFLETWAGLLAFTFQIYFDFSGYSDMAVGLAFMFGIRMPVNFFSPYKATSIIEFWRRWHITLSHFFRDFVYIPLGGGHRFPLRRQINLFLTMLLGGVWHGAGANFIVWGGIHGVLLSINHLFRAAVRGREVDFPLSLLMRPGFGRLITFSLVVIAWVFFRTADWDTATRMLAILFGQEGISLPQQLAIGFPWFADLMMHFGVVFEGGFRSGAFGNQISGVLILCAAAGICWFLPNTFQLFQRDGAFISGPDPIPDDRKLVHLVSRLRHSSCFSYIGAIIAVFLVLNISGANEFVYFQF